MKRILTSAALAALAVSTSGCGALFGEEGLFRDKSNDYLRASTLPPLALPAGVETAAQEELYEVPLVADQSRQAEDFEVPRPQPLAVNVMIDRVKIQKLGTSRWVLVNQPPEEVWPQVRYFLSSAKLPLAAADASAGTLETGWLRFKDDTANKDKYRLQIEEGVQPDTTEIHVLHHSVSNDMPDSVRVDWPRKSDNPEREGWMIDELSSSLATTDAGGAASASLVARAIGGNTANKVRLAEPRGQEPYLAMALRMRRAWATVSHSLNNGAFRTHLDDSDIHIFYVSYDESRLSEEEDGWFSGVFRRDNKEIPADTNLTLPELLANIDPEAMLAVPEQDVKTQRDIPGYIVFMYQGTSNIEVRVRDTRGMPISRNKAAKLLSEIRRNLI
ncbi:outer membrane protein assembly factor BamC [Biformimicrobium ophioploci]|uniref:Outer membrane protein assembly factor BamC n=1 Tax=Biformimicrobium ophioploci TaxID=3036711 RepID=A0ABQ6LYQ5_9GAMM|nr:outer membrane protein assembly factor BamC [Microbulbifer sp. NKW57]GMG87216.1 outer membrane protein assembly factor BamC [Microbulbifer sp. NKW57]